MTNKTPQETVKMQMDIIDEGTKKAFSGTDIPSYYVAEGDVRGISGFERERDLIDYQEYREQFNKSGIPKKYI